MLETLNEKHNFNFRIQKNFALNSCHCLKIVVARAISVNPLINLFKIFYKASIMHTRLRCSLSRNESADGVVRRMKQVHFADGNNY